MIYHYITTFLKSLKKNRFFYSINFIGFLTGFLLLAIISTFLFQQLSFDRFHKNSSNIYRIHSGGYGVTPLCFGEKLKGQIPEISGFLRMSSKTLTVVNRNQEIQLGKAFYTDPEIFGFFSFRLISGNARKALTDPFSLVLSKSAASKLFGTASPTGQVLRDNEGTVYNITGIMEDIPYNSHIQACAFISIETLRHMGDKDIFNCGSWGNLTYVSLSENSDPKLTEAKLNSVLEDSRMGTSDGKIPLELEPLKQIYFDYENNKFDACLHGDMQTVLLYSGISFLILIIIIINYINLSTAISAGRIKEITIRKINGAGKKQIAKQLVVETLGIALISLILALLLIHALLPQLRDILNLRIYSTINWPILYPYFLGCTIIIGVVTGIVPGIILSKTNEVKVLKNESVLNSGGTSRQILLMIQLIIVAILLNSTFIIRSQIDYVFKKDLGFRPENIISFQLKDTLSSKHELLKNSLSKIPGVEKVSFSSGLIGDGFSKAPLGLNDLEKLCSFYSIDPYYLDLYKIKLKYGRNFSDQIKTDISNCCLVNEEACKAFNVQNPVGMIMKNKKEIIGVVRDFNFASLHSKVEPLVLNCCKNEQAIQIKISGTNTRETLNLIKATCNNLFQDTEMNYIYLQERITKMYQSELDLQNSFQVYSAVTLVIAVLGLFALTLFSIKKKTKEICLRKLFGARLDSTFKLFIKEQAWILLISNLLATPISLVIMNNWLGNFEFKVHIGPGIFIKTFITTIIFSLVAISFLIVKTHKSNVIETLRNSE